MTESRVLLVTVLALACLIRPADAAAQSASGGAYAPVFEQTPCPFELPAIAADGVVCGEVAVPENWQNPGARSLRIPVAIFRSTAPEPRPEPILHLGGGPTPTLATAGNAAGSPLRRDRDLVVFDYRGVGFAELVCPELGPAYLHALTRPLPARAATEARTRVAGDCRRWAEEHSVDLREYHARNMARDALAVMDALGYASWNTYAISFGTAVTQHMMRLRPEAVRAAALLGPVALHAETVQLNAFKAALDRMAEYCAADPACAATYPDPRREFETLYAQLERQPLRVPVPAGPHFPEGEMHLTGSGLQRIAIGMLYRRAELAAVPMLVREATRGNPAPVAIAASRLAEPAAALSGANWTTQCDLLGEWAAARTSGAERRADDDYFRVALVLAHFDDPNRAPDASCFEALPPAPFLGAAGGR